MIMIDTFSKKMDGEKHIAPNFKINEFACKDGTDMITIDTDFVINKLQIIRNYFDKPVTIISGYRTYSHNIKCGGANNSYHLQGRAFDISINGISPLEIARYSELIGIKGIIQYISWTHIDSRSNKYFASNINNKTTILNTFI